MARAQDATNKQGNSHTYGRIVALHNLLFPFFLLENRTVHDLYLLFPDARKEVGVEETEESINQNRKRLFTFPCIYIYIHGKEPRRNQIFVLKIKRESKSQRLFIFPCIHH